MHVLVDLFAVRIGSIAQKSELPSGWELQQSSLELVLMGLGRGPLIVGAAPPSGLQNSMSLIPKTKRPLRMVQDSRQLVYFE